MSNITWSTGATFSDGQTLTASNLSQMQSDITSQVNGNIDGDNIKNGSVTTTHLSAPNSIYCIALNCSISSNALNGGSFGSGVSGGLSDNISGLSSSILSGQNFDIPFAVPAKSTLIDYHILCAAVTGATTSVIRRQPGGSGSYADVANTTLTFSAGSLVKASGQTAGAPSEVFTSSDGASIRITVANGSNDGVVAPIVYLYFKSEHSA